MKVFVSGCYDLLHSGHVEFFRQASQYGDLYVGIGSDATILSYKNHHTLYPEQERLFMVKSIRYVKDAFINQGSGVMDFIPTVEALKPDRFVVNADGSSEEKRQFCKERGIEYIVLDRIPAEGLEARSSTSIKATLADSSNLKSQTSIDLRSSSDATRHSSNEFDSALAAPSVLNPQTSNLKPQTSDGIPTRLDLAGTWIDQPYVSTYAPGWAITISLLPTFEIRERCGLSTSTRNQIKRIWPVRLPDMNPEILAKLVFCFENDPERNDGIISGAQDAIGICIPGLCRHYYDAHYWPQRIETCTDEHILSWLEDHLCLIPMFPRRPGCSVIEGKNINETNVKALVAAANKCWDAIIQTDLSAFATAYKDSFNAQTTLFPAMMQPGVQDYIDRYAPLPDVLAWKMPGAGGGGYLALVVSDAPRFCQQHPESIPLKIRRK